MTVEEFKKEHPRIYEKVLEYCSNQGKEPETRSLYAFVDRILWSATDEKGDFWSAIANGRFEGFYDKYPESKTTSELTSLPEKWCIKVTDENINVLGKWRTDGRLTPGISNRYLLDEKNGRKGYCVSCMQTGYTEITFEQFKKWVLKEDVSTVEVKYIECITDEGGKAYLKGKIYKVKRQSDITYWTELDSEGSTTNGWSTKYFKPTTEHAYLTQNDVKDPIEKNLVGRYLKALVDRPQNTSLKIGEFDKLVEKNYTNRYTTDKGWTYTTDNASTNQWEVMPEGFDPNIVKVEEKVETIQEICQRIFTEKGFDKIKKGDNYICIDGRSRIATRNGYISNDKNYIDCGPGYLWDADEPAKFGYKVEEEMEQDVKTTPEKWSAGTYVLMLKESPAGNEYHKGDIAEIKRFNGATEIDYVERKTCNQIYREDEGKIKWFATKKEAEEHWNRLQKGDKVHEELKPSPEWLLEEAKKRYPIGTKCIPLDRSGDSYGMEQIVDFEPRIWESSISSDKVAIEGCTTGLIYINGKWADIISTTVEKQVVASAQGFWERQLSSLPKQLYFGGVDPIDPITPKKSNTNTQLNMLPVKKLRVKKNQNN